MTLCVAAAALCLWAAPETAGPEQRLRAALERDSTDTNGFLRYAVIGVAAQLDRDFARPILERATTDRAYLVAMEAVRLIRDLDLRASCSALAAAMGEEATATRPVRPGSDYVRQEFLLACAVTLVRMDDARGWPVLERLARNSRDVVRQRVGEELKEVTAPAALALLRALARDPGPRVREAAAYAWPTDRLDSADLAVLVGLADDTDRYVSLTALETLSAASPAEARPRLQALLKNHSLAFREAAVDLLADIGAWDVLDAADAEQPLQVRAHIAASAARLRRAGGGARLLALLPLALADLDRPLTALWVVKNLGAADVREALPDLASLARGDVEAHREKPITTAPARTWLLRLEAAMAIAALNDPRVVPTLEALYLVEGAPPAWREVLREGLSALETPPSSAFVEQLLSAADSADRQFAIRLLARAGPATAPARLRRLLREGPASDRVEVALALLGLDDPAGLDVLRERLAGASADTRAALVMRLQAAPHPAALPLLLKALDDPKDIVRLAAGRGLLAFLKRDRGTSRPATVIQHRDTEDPREKTEKGTADGRG